MEKRIYITINESKNSLLGTFATKEETTKRLSLLSKKLREVTEIINNQQKGEEDGMLTKKNFGPINCVSCEKGLTNVQGMPADHSGWKKLPFRENNNERIARYA
jgi:hypothetical protein